MRLHRLILVISITVGGELSRHTELGAENEIQELLCIIKRIATELNVPQAAVSLSWAMQKQGISNTLVGSRNRKQLLSNIEGAEFVLPYEAYIELNKASQPVLDVLGDNPDYYQNREESRIW